MVLVELINDEEEDDELSNKAYQVSLGVGLTLVVLGVHGTDECV